MSKLINATVAWFRRGVIIVVCELPYRRCRNQPLLECGGGGGIRSFDFVPTYFGRDWELLTVGSGEHTSFHEVTNTSNSNSITMSNVFLRTVAWFRRRSTRVKGTERVSVMIYAHEMFVDDYESDASSNDAADFPTSLPATNDQLTTISPSIESDEATDLFSSDEDGSGFVVDECGRALQADRRPAIANLLNSNSNSNSSWCYTDASTFTVNRLTNEITTGEQGEFRIERCCRTGTNKPNTHYSFISSRLDECSDWNTQGERGRSVFHYAYEIKTEEDGECTSLLVTRRGGNSSHFHLFLVPVAAFRAVHQRESSSRRPVYHWNCNVWTRCEDNKRKAKAKSKCCDISSLYGCTAP